MSSHTKALGLALIFGLLGAIQASAGPRPVFADVNYTLTYSVASAHTQGEQVLLELPVTIRFGVADKKFCRIFTDSLQIPCETSEILGKHLMYGDRNALRGYVFKAPGDEFQRLLFRMMPNVCAKSPVACEILNANLGLHFRYNVAIGAFHNGNDLWGNTIENGLYNNTTQLHLRSRNDVSLHITLNFLSAKNI